MAGTGVDPVFEFEAPKYIDFASNVENEEEDAWFDAQKEEPEELTSSALNDDNEEDFGTSDPSNVGFSGSLIGSIKKKKRSMKNTDNRPSKKHRSHNSTFTTSNTTYSMHLTVPKSPYFATKERLRNVMCESEEDMQCRYMASMQSEQTRRRRLNSFYKKKALYSSAGYLPTRSTKPLTEPADVHFRTDERLRGVPSPQIEEPHAPVIEKTESGLTVPRPFQFQLETRVKPEQPQPPKSPYVSFKQKMIQIQNKTPKRFRTLPRNRRLWKLSPQPEHKLGITVPQEFSFETVERVRPAHVLSAEEREALEMENIPKFKALPLDEKILHSGGQLGISRAPKVPLTEPKTPKFTTAERASKREVHHEEEEPQLFKAREFDPSIFQAPNRGVPAFPPKGVTIPESPCLVTKARSVLYPPPEAPKEDTFVFKARPIPIVEPFVPAKTEHKVEVQPFALSTELRGMKSKQEMRDKVRKQRSKEKEKMNFKAQPMPIADEPEAVGFVFAPPPTVPQPFHLKSEERGEQYMAKFQHQLAEEEREKKAKASFKANPIIDVPPFQPHRSDKPLTVISDFALNSDVRSSQRQKFEQHKTEKAKAAEEARKLQEEANKIEEERFIKKMRKKLVHKPMPILQSKPIHVQPSAQPLTHPHTPLLRTRQRANHSGRDF